MKTGSLICILILALFTVLGLLPFFKHYEFTRAEAVVCKCLCGSCREKERIQSSESPGGLSVLKGVRGEDVWQKGEFITFRKAFAHDQCPGNLVFIGEVKPAPYSEKDYFYTHVCDVCSATNQILNAQWPQYKREWRSL